LRKKGISDGRPNDLRVCNADRYPWERVDMTDLEEAKTNMELLRQALKNKTESKQEGAPELVAIDPDQFFDESDLEGIGHTADGRQFFLTTPFEPAWGIDRQGNEFLALFIFDAAGNLLEAKIDQFGPRATMDRDRREALRVQYLQELGEVSCVRIEVKPFFVEKFGCAIGLIPRQDEEDGTWYVEMLPGNYMCFYEPWDGGGWDT
jgi:hypothetical protein